MRELPVVLLRAWFGLRERLGCPKRVPADRFDSLSHVVMLAGSPWVVWTSTSTSAPPARFWITNSTWPVRQG